ncbi:MAG: 5-(carboxyamino)imidazole ribonucleotide synthase [Actinomycetes bacterium]
MGFPVVGIVGGGQLARMMATAAVGLGVGVRVLAESPGSSAARTVPGTLIGDGADLDRLRTFARGVDVLTFDHEQVPTAHLVRLADEGVVVRPGPEALVHAQDKVRMRSRLTAAGLPCPAWERAVDADSVAGFAARHGWPVVLKTTRGGYDGKGVEVVSSRDQAVAVMASLRAAHDDLLVEQHVPFVRELAALVARSPHGQAVAYPVVESVARDGVCAEVTAPAPGLAEATALEAARIALGIAGLLGVTGLLAVELFETAGGGLLVNELAMRPHNTGHWSLDAAVTSQFENHLRAVLDLPLGDPRARAPWTVMANVFGPVDPSVPSMYDAFRHVMARDPGLRVQMYGKEPRAGRKVGHVTAYGGDLADTRERARHAAAYLMGEIDE